MPLTSRAGGWSARAATLLWSILPCLVADSGAAQAQTTQKMTFDVLSAELPADWPALAQVPAEKTWGLLDASRRGTFLTLSRTAQPFEKDPSTLKGVIVSRGTSTLGGRPASSYEWQATKSLSEPLHALVRCTAAPLHDGLLACAMAGVAGIDLEPLRPALTRILDSVRLDAAVATATDRVPAVSSGSAADALGSRLDVTELDGLWIGVWTRRAGTNVFDGVWRSARYPEVHDVVRLEKMTGNDAVFTRDGNGGRYFGKLSSDGSTISGTASWYSRGMTWSGRISRVDSATAGGSIQSPWQNDQLPGQSPGSNSGTARPSPVPDSGQSYPPPPVTTTQPAPGLPSEGGPQVPAPTQRVVKVFDNWNTGVCTLTSTARFALKAPTQITNIELWYNWRQGETVLPFEIRTGGRPIAHGQLTRGACDPDQAAWCTATTSFTASASVGDYAVHVASPRLCRNAGSRNNGFIRVRGLQ